MHDVEHISIYVICVSGDFYTLASDSEILLSWAKGLALNAKQVHG
jgi:hypothetical protein